jgi:hypothetical protein
MCIKTLIAQLETTKTLGVEEFQMIYDQIEENETDVKRVQELLVRIMRGGN